jgi:hypothetical protein
MFLRLRESLGWCKEENKNKRMLRQVQHETRRTLQPELIEGVEAVFFN